MKFCFCCYYLSRYGRTIICCCAFNSFPFFCSRNYYLKMAVSTLCRNLFLFLSTALVVSMELNCLFISFFVTFLFFLFFTHRPSQMICLHCVEFVSSDEQNKHTKKRNTIVCVYKWITSFVGLLLFFITFSSQKNNPLL